MKVLSLFDGMSCGQIALDQLGIPVETYYASEIDKYAIEVTQANYPDTIHVGDVTKLNSKDFADVDLIMGGSPCQGFSFAGKQLAFNDPRSALFFEFIRLLKDIKPKYFLLENVRMKKDFLDIISQEVSKCYPEITFGLEPYLINSSLVSAQSRQRYYWTNIPNIQQPKDKGIVLRDILETTTSEEYYAGQNLQKNYKGGNQLNPNYKSQANTIHSADGKSGTICAGTHGYSNGYVADVDPKYYLSEKAVKYMKKSHVNDWTKGKTREEIYIKNGSQKSNALTANMHKGVPYNVIEIDKPKQKDLTWRKLTPLECERLQTVPDNYTNHVSDTQRYKMLGNGWTVEVIKHILKNINEDK